jgi:Zn-dependent protease
MRSATSCRIMVGMNFDPVGLVFIIFALGMAMTLHEFAHAWMSNALGDRTARNEGRLSLNPLVHIDPFLTVLLPAILIIAGLPVIAAARPVPFNPWAVRWGRWGAALVAAAGPLMNFLLAIIFSIVIMFAYSLLPLIILQLFVLIIQINISLAIFNLIPIPPLDGSRIVYAAIPPIRPLFDRLEHNGIMIIFILFLVGAPVISPILRGITGAIIQILIPGITGLSI